MIVAGTSALRHPPGLAKYLCAFYNILDMRTVFMGNPLFALPALMALLRSRHEVVGVFTAPDRPRGRGLVGRASPVKEYALRGGLPLLQPPSLRDPKVQKEFQALAPDLVVVAAYGRIIPTTLLKVPRYGFVNVHPSLLPQYRGPSPVVTAILDGAPTTGVSLILLDEGLDSGPILAQKRELIAPDETAESLTQRLFQAGAELLESTLALWARGQLSPKPQDQSQATYTRKITKEDGLVNWKTPAQELHKKGRAFTPWPGLYTYWKGRLVKFIRTVPLEGEAGEPLGTVVSLEGDSTVLGVSTGQGVLGILALQLEGRRALTVQEFVRGYPDFLGAHMPS